MEKQIQNLRTVKNYAYDKRVTVTTVYNKLKNGDLKGQKIDGVQFVVVNQSDSKK